VVLAPAALWVRTVFAPTVGAMVFLKVLPSTTTLRVWPMMSVPVADVLVPSSEAVWIVPLSVMLSVPSANEWPPKTPLNKGTVRPVSRPLLPRLAVLVAPDSGSPAIMEAEARVPSSRHAEFSVDPARPVPLRTFLVGRPSELKVSVFSQPLVEVVVTVFAV